MNKHVYNEDFYRELFHQQKQKDAVPSNTVLTEWANQLICVLYPQQSTCVLASEEAVQKAFGKLESDLLNILNMTTTCLR